MHFARLLTPERLRFLKFCVVGGFGAVLNEAIFLLGLHVLFEDLPEGARVGWSGFLAIALTIFTNFLMNDAWTWGDREKRGRTHFFARLGRYYLVASGAAVMNWLILKALTAWAGLTPWLANLIGIAAGMAVNFLVNNLWTFRARRQRS